MHFSGLISLTSQSSSVEMSDPCTAGVDPLNSWKRCKHLNSTEVLLKVKSSIINLPAIETHRHNMCSMIAPGCACKDGTCLQPTGSIALRLLQSVQTRRVLLHHLLMHVLLLHLPMEGSSSDRGMTKSPSCLVLIPSSKEECPNGWKLSAISDTRPEQAKHAMQQCLFLELGNTFLQLVHLVVVKPWLCRYCSQAPSAYESKSDGIHSIDM